MIDSSDFNRQHLEQNRDSNAVATRCRATTPDDPRDMTNLSVGRPVPPVLPATVDIPTVDTPTVDTPVRAVLMDLAIVDMVSNYPSHAWYPLLKSSLRMNCYDSSILIRLA